MIKKFVKCLVFCSCLAFGLFNGDCCGMDVKDLIPQIAENPDDNGKLIMLVSELTNEKTGSDNTDVAIDVAQSIDVREELKPAFEKIVCMIFGVAHDWCCGYKRMHFPEYYIEGAKSGKFGPYYNIPNDQNS